MFEGQATSPVSLEKNGVYLGDIRLDNVGSSMLGSGNELFSESKKTKNY